MTAVLITTLLGMVGAGTVSYLLARHSTYDGIQRALSQENAEIKTVAAIAEAGNAGRPIRGPGDVLYVAIKSTVPDPDEAILGLVGGKVTWVPQSDDAFQQTLADDEELVRAAASTMPGEPVFVRQLRTSAHGPLAFISVPIQVRGSTDLGHYVAAVDVRAAMAPVNRTHLTYAAICLLALLVVGFVGYQVAGRLLSPLRTLRRTAQQITDTDLRSRIPEELLSSKDEVADLGRTMNAMLDRLSTSFDAQRRMLDDAGHELRTPITVVRGHLELVDADDPVDVIKTRDLALDELDRMQRLVEELMVLAKASRPDFIRLEEVALDELIYAVFEKVSPIADRRWTVDAASESTGWLDPQRITQALLQLVANAVRFTEAGAVIALGARTDGTEHRLWVRDTGAGIEPADQELIFERFHRGAQGTSRTTDDGGAGLGLSIVNAIVEAHHGTVIVDSTPGHGATFTMIIPQRTPAAAADRPTGPALEEQPWPRS